MSYVSRSSVEISAPIGHVWSYLLDHHGWRRPFVKSVRTLTDGKPGVGTRYEADAAGRVEPVINEITRFEPPHRLTWTQVNDDASITTTEGSYILEELPDGRTRFTFENTYATSGVASLFDRLARWVDKRFIGPRLLRQLREAVEQP